MLLWASSSSSHWEQVINANYWAPSITLNQDGGGKGEQQSEFHKASFRGSQVYLFLKITGLDKLERPSELGKETFRRQVIYTESPEKKGQPPSFKNFQGFIKVLAYLSRAYNTMLSFEISLGAR